MFGIENLLPIVYVEGKEEKIMSHELHPALERRMEQLQILDLTWREAEGNMENIQLLRKEKHDKEPRKKKCKKCSKVHDKKKCENKENGEKKNDTPPMFYPGQCILWQLKQKNP